MKQPKPQLKVIDNLITRIAVRADPPPITAISQKDAARAKWGAGKLFANDPGSKWTPYGSPTFLDRWKAQWRAAK